MKLLKKCCESELAKYPEPLEEDLKIMQTPDIPYNEKNCLLVRISEKKVIIL